MKLHLSVLFTLLFISNITYSQEVKIAAIGDFGAANEGAEFAAFELAVANLVKTWDQPNSPLDAVLTVGDNNYPSGLAADIEINIGQFYGEFIEGHPNHTGGPNRFYPSIGNHDYGEMDCSLPGDPSPYLDYFNLPGNEFYYDYVIGNVHFFVVDSDCHQTDGVNESSIQAQWLENAMMSSTQPWKIVYFHHAPYASEINNSTGTGALRWDFKAWGATAVIGGHYHFYERFNVDDLLYFVNGIGGNALHHMETPIAGSQFQYNQKHGAMLMTFSESQANFKLINIDNELIDNYTILLGDPCAQSGGDSDHDGICDDDDCEIDNALLPSPSGFTCDDNNPFTENDTIQMDGCSCSGTFNPNALCEDLTGFIKVGEFNDHAYYLSEKNAAGWIDAKNQCENLGGYLISIEDQEEKDYIEQFITGEDDNKIFFIGLSRDLDSNFIWTSDQSIFNENNYTNSPWGSGGIPSVDDFVTLRKWNPNSNVTWGSENGNAFRRFILEKECSLDCSKYGEDSDGDGICNDFDCQPNNNAFPATPGTSCNDDNSNTTNDMVTSDGCGCVGTPTNGGGGTGECTVTSDSCSITLSELNSDDFIKIFDASFEEVWRCSQYGDNPTLCNSTETITDLTDGIYFVEACGVTEPYTISCNNPPNGGGGGNGGGNGGGTGDCTVTSDSCSITLSGLNSDDFIKIFDASFDEVWRCSQYENNPNLCDSVEIVTGLANGIYFVQACDVTEPYIIDCSSNINIAQGKNTSQSSTITANEITDSASKATDLNSFIIFPNPAQDEIHIDLKPFAGQRALIQIFNAQGILVKTHRVDKASTHPERIDLKGMANGLYLISVKLDGHQLMTQPFNKKTY